MGLVKKLINDLIHLQKIISYGFVKELVEILTVLI